VQLPVAADGAGVQDHRHGVDQGLLGEELHAGRRRRDEVAGAFEDEVDEACGRLVRQVGVRQEEGAEELASAGLGMPLLKTRAARRSAATPAMASARPISTTSTG